MRSTVALLIFSLLACQASAAIVARNEDNVLQKDGFHLLCKPCQKFFNALKKDLPEISEVTEDVLKSLIDNECAALDWIPFLDKICDKILDWGIDKLFDLIVKQDGKIDPQHDCQALKMC